MERYNVTIPRSIDWVRVDGRTSRAVVTEVEAFEIEKADFYAQMNAWQSETGAAQAVT